MTVFITNIIATCRFQENVLLPMCAQDNQEFYPLLETPGKNITLSSTFEKYIKYLYFAAKLDLLQPVEWTVRGSNPGWGGGEIFLTRPDRPWGPPSLLYNGYRVSFSGVKRPGRGTDHPPPSKCRGHEMVGLYLYSPSGPSWPVTGRTFTFTFTD